jgi:hypothetical protein
MQKKKKKKKKKFVYNTVFFKNSFVLSVIFLIITKI